jgi:hypothetical protein
MDKETFRRLAAHTKLKQRAREMAREILVEGQNPAAVRPAHGVFRQAARSAADRVLAELKGKEISEAWQTVTVVVPFGIAKVIRYLEGLAHARAGLKPFPEEVPYLRAMRRLKPWLRCCTGGLGSRLMVIFSDITIAATGSDVDASCLMTRWLSHGQRL